MGKVITSIALIGPTLKGIFGSGAGKGLRLPGTVGEDKKVSWTDQLAEELHKQAKRRFPTRRVRVGGVGDTWSADLVDMQSFSKYNDRILYLLNVIEVFSKYEEHIPYVEKTVKCMDHAFDTISKRKPGRLWVGQDGEYDNRTTDHLLEDNLVSKYISHTMRAKWWWWWKDLIKP